jgi:hypothetical protein
LIGMKAKIQFAIQSRTPGGGNSSAPQIVLDLRFGPLGSHGQVRVAI